MSCHTVIVCDGCGTVSHVHERCLSLKRGEATEELRHELRIEGWRVAQPGGVDYCWGCVDKEERDACAYVRQTIYERDGQ
jgi:hypothetical protein